MRLRILQAVLLFIIACAPVSASPQQQQPPQPPDKPRPTAPPSSEQPGTSPVLARKRPNPATGSWKAEDVPFAPWRITLTAAGATVTGTVSQGATDRMQGARTDQTGPVEIYDGAVDGDSVSFKCKSPDGDRMVTFAGVLSADEITFTRQVEVRKGGRRGENGIFGAFGSQFFVVRRESDPYQNQAAQQPPPEQPPAEKPPADKPPAAPSAKPSAPPAGSGQGTPSSTSSYDPFHAAQDIDVGIFYMHKGDYDAAIDRFKDAIRLKPNFARPRLLLGEIYEKKGDTREAIRYYKEFLEILPDGPDSGKVRGRLEKLGAK